jgi:hypothetical protein
MQLTGYGLPRIHLPGTSVNKGISKGWGCSKPRPLLVLYPTGSMVCFNTERIVTTTYLWMEASWTVVRVVLQRFSVALYGVTCLSGLSVAFASGVPTVRGERGPAGVAAAAVACGACRWCRRKDQRGQRNHRHYQNGRG